MKKFLILLLMLPIVAFAQKSNEQKSKYEDFISKTGVCTTITYKIPSVEIEAAYGEGQYKETISFSLEKITIGNASLTFLELFHSKFDEVSSAMIEASDVKAIYNAIAEMQKIRKNPKPEGAASVKHTFFGNDGVSVECNDNSWTIRLERYNKDNIWIKDIEPFSNRLQEIIQKIDSIK